METCSFSTFKSFIRANHNYKLLPQICERSFGGASSGIFYSQRAEHPDVATPLGFEPRITPPKGAVLPTSRNFFDRLLTNKHYLDSPSGVERLLDAQNLG